MLEFCQPCGDTVPKKIKITSVTINSDNSDGTRGDLKINGQAEKFGHDLAYVYVPFKKKTSSGGDGGVKVVTESYKNLAVLTDCTVSGVSEKVTYETWEDGSDITVSEVKP